MQSLFSVVIIFKWQYGEPWGNRITIPTYLGLKKIKDLVKFLILFQMSTDRTFFHSFCIFTISILAYADTESNLVKVAEI
jgi:hypothetical protein